MSGRSDVLIAIDIRRDQQLVERQVLLREHRVHAERRRLRGDGPADPAAADDAELLSAQLGAEHEVERPALPAAAPDQPIPFARCGAPRSRISPQVNSAVASVSTSGVLVTITPRAFAAATSMLS